MEGDAEGLNFFNRVRWKALNEPVPTVYRSPSHDQMARHSALRHQHEEAKRPIGAGGVIAETANNALCCAPSACGKSTPCKASAQSNAAFTRVDAVACRHRQGASRLHISMMVADLRCERGERGSTLVRSRMSSGITAATLVQLAVAKKPTSRQAGASRTHRRPNREIYSRRGYLYKKAFAASRAAALRAFSAS